MVKIGPYNLFSRAAPTVKKIVTEAVGVKQLRGLVPFTGDTRKISSEIGEPHPFDYTVTEGLYLKMGFVNGVVNKLIDFVWGPGFFTKSEDEKSKTVVDQWLQDVNFDVHGRLWLREALVKGAGFLELGGDLEEVPQGIKVLNSNCMFVKRDKKGQIMEYNQLFGDERFAAKKESAKVSFKPFQIAQFNFNALAGAPYGCGLVYSSLTTLNNLLQNEKDMQTVTSRKAGAPYVIKLNNGGDEEVQVTDADVSALGNKLQFLNNKTEWVFGPNVDVEKIDFGDLGANFNTAIKHNIDMLIFAFQVPEVILGRGNIPEGLAKVQMDAFERRIKSIQAELEKVIEEKIFKRILQANGFDAHVEFEWGQPSENQTNERLIKLNELLKSPFLSMALRTEVEKQIAALLGLDVRVVETIDEEREREEEEPQPIVPGQNSNEMLIESVTQDYDLREWLGFNYRKFVSTIQQVLQDDPFDVVRAQTVEELAGGRLDEIQVENLRKALKSGFKNGHSINKIADRIREEVRPGDAFAMKEGKIILNADGNPRLALSAAQRPIVLARTETTRIANLGSVTDYKESQVEKYRWVAALSDRTCPECEGLNGRIFDVNEAPALPPAHVMCRCTIVPVTDLDEVL